MGSQFDLCVPIFKAMNSQIKLRNFRQRRMILWEMTVEQQLTIYRGTTRWLNYYSPSKFGHIFFVHPFKVQKSKSQKQSSHNSVGILATNTKWKWTIFGCGNYFFMFWLIFWGPVMHIFLVNFGVITFSSTTVPQN